MVPSQQAHVPVLLGAALQYLDPKPGETYLDLTAGYGGHASKIMERTKYAPAVLVDRDQDAIDYLQDRFAGKPVSLIRQDFQQASRDLLSKSKQFDLILADLGVSSVHLNIASRGFSLKNEGPLDMRMDQDQALTAETIVNNYKEADLAKLIRDYGEEPRAHKIALVIAQHRPLRNTTELADLIARNISRRGRSKIHPATRTFQALRMAVNSELQQLEQALPLWTELLKPGGRIAVISFHSLEDRLVKRAWSEISGEGYDAILRLLTKNPVTADRLELDFNPRARSAKLRVAAKINT